MGGERILAQFEGAGLTVKVVLDETTTPPRARLETVATETTIFLASVAGQVVDMLNKAHGGRLAEAVEMVRRQLARGGSR